MIDVAALWEAEYSGLCRFLQCKLRGDHAGADDIASEAFAKVWAKRDQYREVPGGSPKRWLYQIAINTLRDHLRRKRPFFWREEDPEPAYTLRFDEIEARSDMQRILGALPDRQRAVIIGRFYEDRPSKDLEEIATLEGVKKLQQRALANLRRDLERVA